MKIRDWIEENLENIRQSQSVNIKCKCPFCGIDEGQFAINSETGAYRCCRSKCDNYGTQIEWIISHVEDLSLKEVREKYDIVRTKLSGLQKLNDKYKYIKHKEFKEALPAEYIPCWEDGRDPEYRIPKYLADRKILKEVLKDFGVGFCLAGDFRNRIIIPISTPDITAFTARTVLADIKPKYKNAPGDWAQGALLGWSLIKPGQDLIICEGPFDMLRLRSLGFNAVALLGKELYKQQADLIKKLPSNTNIFIMMDPQEPKKTTNKIASQLYYKFNNIYVTKLNAEDPGEANEEQVNEAIDTALRWNGALG